MDEHALSIRLEAARTEHRDLDGTIEALAVASVRDEMALARLKRRKLRLRDEIVAIEDLLAPDVLA